MRWSLVLFLTLAGMTGGNGLHAAAPVAAPALTHVEPAEFWALPALAEPIDVEAVNRPLLIAAIFHETNRRRLAEGLPAFLPLDRLDAAADMQAAMIALRQQIGHENPLPRQGTSFLRVKDTGLDPELVAENVAMTSLLNPPVAHELFVRIVNGRRIFFTEPDGPEAPVHSYASYARAVLDQWMNSPGHRANILNPQLRFLGCAARTGKNSNLLDAIYGVQVFFQPRRR